MWLVIGISGCTCSGKSSLANSLHEALPGSVLICQDNFFFPEDSDHHTWIPDLNHINWEIISSMDMEKMHETVKSILCSEGTCISQYALEKALQDIIHRKEDETEVALKSGDNRSMKVGADKPNTSGYRSEEDRISSSTSAIKILIIEGFLIFNDKILADLCQMKYFLTLDIEECFGRRSVRVYNPPDIPGYFEQHVWPEYVKHRDQVFEQVPDVVVINGKQDKTSTLKQVLEDVVHHLKGVF